MEQMIETTPSQPCFIHSGENCPPIRFFNCDNLEFMRTVPDKYYDLAIVDPPYGIDINNQSQGKGGGVARKIEYIKKDWDKNAPNASYFDELKRVSKNQIIWGANHFLDNMPFNLNAPCWIVWDKDNGDTDFADCEMAWTSFKTAVRRFKWTWAGMRQQNMKHKDERIHPTQKPRALYQWILQKYANKGDKILDTHGGSMSIAQACELEGFALDIMEIDPDYFRDGLNAFKQHIRQARLF